MSKKGAAAGASEEENNHYRDRPMITMPVADFYGFFNRWYQKSMIKLSFFNLCFGIGFGFFLALWLVPYLYLKLSQAFMANWLLYPLTGMVTALLMISIFLIYHHRRH
jgi:hypothetical protein